MRSKIMTIDSAIELEIVTESATKIDFVIKFAIDFVIKFVIDL